MKRTMGILIALCLIFAAPVLAQDAKVGYVDLQKALNLSAAGKEAKEKIAGTVKEYEGTIEARQKELKQAKEELEKQALVLAEEARGAKEREYQQKLKEFQRFTKDIQEELQMKDADYTRRILEGLFEVVKEIGKKEGYTVILEHTESSILYADESIDLTDKVIKAYNARYKAAAGK